MDITASADNVRNSFCEEDLKYIVRKAKVTTAGSDERAMTYGEAKSEAIRKATDKPGCVYVIFKSVDMAYAEMPKPPFVFESIQ